MCKSILSLSLLNYPPPTLINFGKIYDDEEGSDKNYGSHIGKIHGVYEFLSRDSKVRDDDLVLVVDGYDMWFQLPPEVLIKRYLSIIKEANKKLMLQYGTVLHKMPWAYAKDAEVLRYNQTVVFGADKLCWPNRAEDVACSSIPESPLPIDVYGPDTDLSLEGFFNRPRYLNSGAVIGPVKDVRAIYQRAREKIEQGIGHAGDQFLFAEIFGEQEYYRQFYLASKPGRRFMNRWNDQHSGISDHSKRSSNISTNTRVPSIDPKTQNVDFSIGIDYKSSLFQTMTHSGGDISFILQSNAATLSTLQKTHEIPNPKPLTPAPDLPHARPPFFDPQDNLLALATSTLQPLSEKLDLLPENLSWPDIPLAMNLYTDTVPVTLHINGDKFLLDSWWPRMWFQPYARALLRQHLRTPQPLIWDTVDGQEVSWDERGGRGGVWTTDRSWMGWKEICRGYEDSIFMDGKGLWGHEDGEWKLYNKFERLIAGGDNPAAKS